MGKIQPHPVTDLRSAQPEIGDQLKRMFGEMTEGPLPCRLLELADRLEEAFQRGELFEPCATKRTRAS